PARISFRSGFPRTTIRVPVARESIEWRAESRNTSAPRTPPPTPTAIPWWSTTRNSRNDVRPGVDGGRPAERHFRRSLRSLFGHLVYYRRRCCGRHEYLDPERSTREGRGQPEPSGRI